MPEEMPLGTMPIAIDDTENLTREEALAKVSMILAETKNPKILSDFSEQEIGYMTALRTMAEEYDIKILRTLTDNIAQYRVSKLRMGRKEILEIASEVRRVPERMLRGGMRSLFSGFR